jgi:hypothetical protein
VKKAAALSILAVAVQLVVGVLAHAQPTGKIFRVGFLDTSTASGMAVLIDAFRQELSKLGWIEGKNFTIEYRFAELAVKYRLPAIYFQREFVDEGGLMSYGEDFDDLFRRAAVYVDKILKGAKPADLPVQQAMKFEFVINLKAAKQIGLTLSPAFLSRANQVIK